MDSATTHTILRNRNYFTHLKAYEGNVTTISGVFKLIEGSGKAIVLLPHGTKLVINDALYSSKFHKNLLSFKDVHQNIAVYVDDLNIVGTSHELKETAKYLMKEFEMKDLGKTNLCLGLQIEHLDIEIFVHQSNYTEKILRKFNMDKAHPLSSPIEIRFLNVDKDQFRPREGRRNSWS